MCILWSGSPAVPNTVHFFLGSRKKVLEDGCRIAGKVAISAPSPMQHNVSCSGGGKSVFCGPALPPTATQNTDLQFEQAELVKG